jgi:hypothetical protein
VKKRVAIKVMRKLGELDALRLGRHTLRPSLEYDHGYHRIIPYTD